MQKKTKKDYFKTRAERVSEKLEESYGRKLTNRQKEFARHYVEGTYSNAECARLAGYSDKDGKARNRAYALLNEKEFPHLAEYIKDLREEREKKYGVTLMGQLKRFRELSIKAEEENQFSAAVNAEKIRSSLGGLTIDRRETNHYHAIENMSREEIEKRLSELRNNHPNAFEGDYEVVNESATREPVLEKLEETST
jgi:phage terminase small subunit|tara:strand:- start:943 stop:1530 length:588 start_codon:yes stop_codon:yes gene_type:complete